MINGACYKDWQGDDGQSSNLPASLFPILHQLVDPNSTTTIISGRSLAVLYDCL